MVLMVLLLFVLWCVCSWKWSCWTSWLNDGGVWWDDKADDDDDEDEGGGGWGGPAPPVAAPAPPQIPNVFTGCPLSILVSLLAAAEARHGLAFCPPSLRSRIPLQVLHPHHLSQSSTSPHLRGLMPPARPQVERGQSVAEISHNNKKLKNPLFRSHTSHDLSNNPSQISLPH